MDDTVAIAREMWDRIEGEISEKDGVAISTAIVKAALAGVNRGLVDSAAQLAEKLPGASVSVEPPAEVPDAWRKQYGADE